MSKSQRDKGARWEREVAEIFRALYPEAKRCFQFRDGSECPDVLAGPWWIECKVGKLPNPRAALKQATKNAPVGYTPIAVIKDDRQHPFVVLSLDDFLVSASGQIAGSFYRSQDNRMLAVQTINPPDAGTEPK